MGEKEFDLSDVNADLKAAANDNGDVELNEKDMEDVEEQLSDEDIEVIPPAEEKKAA